MEKKEKKVLENIKESAKEQVGKIKEFAKEVETNVSEHQDFKRYSVKVKRVNAKILNLETALYGVFDQVKLTLTYRVKDEFNVNEIIEVGGNMYQISSIKKNTIMFPLTIDGKNHEVECRVASLSAVSKEA